MASEDQMLNRIRQVVQETNQMKTSAASLRGRAQALASQPVMAGGNSLANNLRSFLPNHLVPQNVGNINHVSWPFYYTVDFDLSTTSPWIANAGDLTASTKLEASFQVSQEAAFLLTAVTRHANQYGEAGDLGPLQVEFRDRQSSRFFNNRPIPIQVFGQKGYETILPTPMILMPNAFFDITLSTFLADGVTQDTPGDAGSGKHTFTFIGYRFRIEDAKKVLSSIYGR